MVINYKKICIAGIFAAVVLFIWMIVYVWNFTVDDAFISFRYSAHLASGYGLAWNIGQPPVEGYTNFLWVIILALSFILKLNPVLSVKLIGLVSVFGIIIIFWLITNDIFKEKKNKLIALTVSILFFLINPYTAIHTVSGLETMLFAFLLLGVMYSAWKITISFSSRFVWLFALSALLLSLTRPEGVLVSLGLIISIIYISIKKNNNFSLSNYLPILILYLIPIVIYNIFRVLFFNELFPLPFIAKMINGITYPEDFFLALIYLTPFISIILASFYLKNKEDKPQDNPQKICFNYFLLIFGITFVLVNIIYVFTPHMNFSQRYFYPSFVLVYTAFGVAISILLAVIEKNKLNLKLSKNNCRNVIFLVIILILLFANFYGIRDLRIQHDYGTSFDQSTVPLAKALSPFSDNNYTVAYGDAGAIAYYSGWNFLDLMGLNNEYIAHNGVTSQYLEQEKPELIIFMSVNGKIIGFKKAYEYVLNNNYTKLEPIKLEEDRYFILFLKPNIKDYDTIKNALEKVSKTSKST